MKIVTGRPDIKRRKHYTQNKPRAMEECPYHQDCANCVFGYCTILEDLDFGDRDCPFYKSKAQFKKDFEASIERLKSIGRMDLIELYHPREAKKIERSKIQH